MKPIYIIVACSENRIIGKDGGLPWSIPEDTDYFRNKVKGGIVIEGRCCFEETGEAFPDSDTIVLSRDPLFSPRGVLAAVSLPLALELAQGLEGDGPIWICGGESIYEESLPLAEKLYLTVVHAEVEGDTSFPEWKDYFSAELECRKSSDESFNYTFFVLAKEAR
ncbi:dihydrofolate reductase [Opitutia bacterium ISCC 51]|nr:dihydrofolate reductase [Opitutae bacterium ISCC 51]QXD28079.1 dihydrofolate reductase [Opitutae bacterium ISCC 52]